jgi:hypothetical protein
MAYSAPSSGLPVQKTRPVILFMYPRVPHRPDNLNHTILRLRDNVGDRAQKFAALAPSKRSRWGQSLAAAGRRSPLGTELSRPALAPSKRSRHWGQSLKLELKIEKHEILHIFPPIH